VGEVPSPLHILFLQRSLVVVTEPDLPGGVGRRCWIWQRRLLVVVAADGFHASPFCPMCVVASSSSTILLYCSSPGSTMSLVFTFAGCLFACGCSLLFASLLL
jgi:hypothetical protein